MTYAGLDIGGTKIEVQVFSEDWREHTRRRVPTPAAYPDLVAATAEQITWAEAEAGPLSAVGVGAAGLVSPITGAAFTANLSASGNPFPSDIAQAAGRPVTYLNDCRAMALSEAVFGAGRGHRTVLALIIGTGIGGGIAIDGALNQGPTATGGEFGHIAAPAHIVARHKLPIVRCGCGRMGCIETFVAGPGIERLARHITGRTLTAPEVAKARHGDMKEVWTIWSALAAEMIHGLTLTVDPDVIVLGGGLSSVPGVVDDLMESAQAAQISGFSAAPIVLAEGGETSGARGAAYAAWKMQSDA
ncbi:MAG: ROK family protein [Pseudomonadota bacterium]